MSSNDDSRRDFIKKSGVVAGGLSLASISGCMSNVPLGGSSGSSGGVLGGGNASFESSLGRNWIYEPGTARDASHYRFTYLKPSAIAEAEEEFDEVVFDQLEGHEDLVAFTDIPFEDMNDLLVFSQSEVFTAAFKKEDVVGELEDNDFDDEGEYEGYAVYESDDGTTAVGIKGGTVVVGHETGTNDGLDVVEETIDTQLGEVDRFVDEEEEFPALLDSLGEATISYGYTHEPTQPVSGDLPEGTQTISYGQTVEEELSSDDETAYGGRHRDVYAFYGQSGDSVTVTMESQPGDTIVMLADTSLNRLAMNDDYDSNYNSQLQHTLESTGMYTIIATSYSPGATFPYQLTLESSGSGSSPAAFGRFENEVARGFSASVDASTTSGTLSLVFEDDGDVDTGDVEDWIDENTDNQEPFHDFDDISVQADGRVVTVTGTIDTDDLALTLAQGN